MSILILCQICSNNRIILLFFVLKMSIKMFLRHKSLDLRVDWHRVLLLRQVNCILRVKKSFSICTEVALPFFSKLT